MEIEISDDLVERILKRVSEKLADENVAVPQVKKEQSKLTVRPGPPRLQRMRVTPSSYMQKGRGY